MKLLNALSLNMVDEPEGSIHFKEMAIEQARCILSAGFESAVGHAETAAVLTSQLGTTVSVSRTTVALKKGDRAVVAQYKGPRLPAGATSLPGEDKITWYLIQVT